MPVKGKTKAVKPPNRKESSQSQAFIAASRDVGCDESGKNFDKTLGKIGRALPLPKPKEKKRKPLRVAL
jgi:hypothetical protein